MMPPEIHSHPRHLHRYRDSSASWKWTLCSCRNLPVRNHLLVLLETRSAVVKKGGAANFDPTSGQPASHSWMKRRRRTAGPCYGQSFVSRRRKTCDQGIRPIRRRCQAHRIRGCTVRVRTKMSIDKRVLYDTRS